MQDNRNYKKLTIQQLIQIVIPNAQNISLKVDVYWFFIKHHKEKS